MNDVDALMSLLKDRKQLISYVIGIMQSSNKNAAGLRAMKERGFSQEGMLEKVIEVTAIQADQMKHLALIALIFAQDGNFSTSVANMAMKLGGNGVDILRTMMDAKFGK